MAYPFEENWARPIANIRAELGLISTDNPLEGQATDAISHNLAKEGVAA
ncbi:MAG: hypothetical protein ACFCU8_16585 [Thermosynechococcaceae cyanobacterium]